VKKSDKSEGGTSAKEKVMKSRPTCMYLALSARLALAAGLGQGAAAALLLPAGGTASAKDGMLGSSGSCK